MENSYLTKVCLLLVAGLFTAIQPVSSAPLSRQQVSSNVQKFLEEKRINTKMTPVRHAPLKDVGDGQGNAPYYVFNIGDGEGFVIASGDDRSRAILGYADEGKIVTDSMPDGLKWMLGFYEEQIQHAPSHARPLMARTSKSYPAVEPLLTTKWNQYAPFNANCPLDNNDNYRQCLTGCVATAMAQVMYYHRKKSTGKLLKRIPGYEKTSNQNIYTIIHLDPIPKGSKIDWDNMLDVYTSGNYTEEQAQAVANLMLYCGASVDMSYGTFNSLSNSNLVPEALQDYFGYKKSECIKRDDYTDEEWEDIIYSELSKGKPIYYSGGYHAVVVDGHDGNGYVHVNWGWGGSSDGFYLLSAVEGSDEKVLNGYSSYQQAVISIEPDCPPLETVNISITSSCTIEGISHLSHIPLELQIEVANNDLSQGTFHIGFLSQTDGIAQPWSSLAPNDAATIQAGGRRTLNRSYSIPSDIKSGLYTLEPYYEIQDPNTGSLAEEPRKLANRDMYVSMVVMDDRAMFFVGEPEWACDTIVFKDSLAKVYCVLNWDCDGNGELSTHELSCVKRLESFNNLRYLESFDELKYFTGLEEIRDKAFWGTNISSLVIPENVKTIGNAVFFNTKIDSIFIPKNVRSIGSEVFWNAPIQSVRVDEGNRWYDSRNSCNAIMETVTNTLLAGCKNTVIPNDTKKIGAKAFWSCSDLYEIAIPESVTCIGDTAFLGTRISSITLPESLKKIGNNAFSSTQLTSIVFPNSVEVIGDLAFSFTKIDSVFIPKNVRHIGKSLLYQSPISSIEVSEANKWYDSRNGCNAIIETASNTLVEGCEKTFIPNGIEAIGDWAFRSRKIWSVTLPESLTRIGKNAFYYTKLNSITIPRNVMEIGDNAFDGTNISSRYVKVLNPQPIEIGVKAFNDLTSSNKKTVLYVPHGSKPDYETATGWNIYSKIIELGDVNCDESVNITDISQTVNHILRNTPSQFDKVAADVNGDDAINIGDITQMIQDILKTTE